ncbi:rod shape-determining protein MreC [Aliivibrio fischeri]|uniref:Cell shape-determining protein MreC n=2 Tax=Aliivibrio fischeri TaxID=668 RepID=Q5E7X8_ALIF1|nr:rod shape-determining protein MreC [Aliivibrio fischeri]AAW84868.1 cell wall structural complex MreBCD transmembrane component MreC [Aliivibrio fischeri ES114]KLU77434.1 rod shape-determining protein MreC [Aliivibrio fischeri]MBP3140921.1 rod shape-determining protein MreC [Aliivibrio fischeri]MBP3155771.1 rod shape-determining protein MreC [Aliivibrio fischeri]MCE7537399.1 rod shape-determining protein MreC [Aliivibrio fischeri]
MTPIFGRGPSLQFRLFIAVMVSASLMLADSRLNTFSDIRYLLNSFVSPIHYAANLPRTMFNGMYERFNSRNTLMLENQRLKQEMFVQNSNLLLMEQLKQENSRLRNLLGSPFIRDEKKMVTEVMAVDSAPYTHQVMIDKGAADGVYEGQPVISDKGIVGQINNVGAHNSRVLLLTDANNAIPVQAVRNDIRVIASGKGHLDTMQLEHIPTNTDLKVGDLLVTSGLGLVYPEGYPVGYISKIDNDNKRPFASIDIETTVEFDKLRYLLLVWPTGKAPEEISDGE